MAAQSVAFEQHLELAAAAGKSVVIHQRDSWEDTIEVLRKYSTRVRAVMHCFDAGLAQAQEVVDLGHFVSFAGIVTFENASEVREPAKSVPIERIMVETGAPISRRHQPYQTLRTLVHPRDCCIHREPSRHESGSIRCPNYAKRARILRIEHVGRIFWILSKKFRGKELPRLANWRRQFSLKTDAISWRAGNF